jgi:predicted metal-binding membrane protein
VPPRNGLARHWPTGDPLTGQLATIGLLLAVAAVAWAVTDLRMAGMDMGPGTDPGAFGFYISTWVVMMAAMMFPSIAPMVLIYRNLQLGRRAQGAVAPKGATMVFVAGYLLVWGVSGLLAYAVLKAGRAWAGDVFAWDAAGRWTAVAVILAAAAYEFTPLKLACLTKCRGPLGFLISTRRDSRRGALAMGTEHGLWCIGCCWALMAALFALGAMSIAWMLVVGALIAAEKLLAWRGAAVTGVAAALAALAIGIAVAPANVPALTVPGGSPAMSMSTSMH